MIIEYTPEGGEVERLDAGRLRASEIQVIERTGDGRWADIKEAMSEGDIGALRVVAWAVKKRTEPSLRFGDFDPFEDEMRIRLDAREVRDYAERLFAKYGNSPEDLAAAFRELRDVAADGEACEAAIADVTAPKDPAPAESSPSPASLSVA
ncbi:hypothetical protein [Streptomyces himalayensis]|uniref:Uncharacterized protein n=1 Tax=Streptomyces himalayensis subsp. himalayensis TaxID=2756131 RepID=A0A7W0DVD0_9ACTN|nr:hypothetical protein [Streptomyces himalayensis]MBA2951585.1 hypothetical protein [Streptomyces himalayensis subsp. himalayensis]